jgi:hypothetical protein
MNFIDQVLEGEVLETEIDSFVEKWHHGAGANKSLAKFLGMTEQEYALWVEHPQALRSILFCRKYKIDLSERSSWQDAHRVAARSQEKGDPNELLRWLKETGRLD